MDRVPDPGSSATCGTSSDLPGLLWDTSSRLIFTDGSVDPAEGRAGCGFYVPITNYRFGVRLSDDSSVLFAELYAIFSAVKYILRMGIADSVILSDSRVALVCIRDRFIDSRVPYIVHSVSRLLLPTSLGRTLRTRVLSSAATGRPGDILTWSLASERDIFCTGEHFARMGWDLETGCDCGAEL